MSVGFPKDQRAHNILLLIQIKELKNSADEHLTVVLQISHKHI